MTERVVAACAAARRVDARHRALASRLHCLHLGLGAVKRDVDFTYFHRQAANAPRTADGLWSYAQMARWGQLVPTDRAQAAAACVFRPDLYRLALPDAALDTPAVQAFDRVELDANDVTVYLEQFALRTPSGAAQAY